jgi:hypothetical protein
MQSAKGVLAEKMVLPNSMSNKQNSAVYNTKFSSENTV